METFWARCKLSPLRVYWVVGVLLEYEVIADGYTKTVEEAEHIARQIAGPAACDGPASWADERHRRKVQEARLSRPAKSSGAEVRRYVYRSDYSEYDGHRHVMAHPVLNWTAKRLYVSEECCEVEANGDHGPILRFCVSEGRTFLLDRAVLEAEGHAFARSRRWHDMFFLRLEDALDPYRRHQATPPDEVIEALTILELPWPCTLREVRSSYRRRSKETHPDAGGDATSFVRVKDAYDVVMDGLEEWPGLERVAS